VPSGEPYPGSKGKFEMAASKQSRPIVSLRPIRDRAKLDAVMNAVSGFVLSESPEWSDLDILSKRTELEGIDAVPEGIFEEDSKFSALGTVYVSLNYGDKDEETITSSDAFPAHIEGHFEGTGKKVRAIIDSFNVDTSSFLE
jgi:hypothetical protein